MGKKWLSYFDLLGFGNFVRDHSISEVFYRYEQSLTELRYQESLRKGRRVKLGFVHFSDTFLIYAPDDTASSFVAIDSASRWFFNLLLARQIPVSGAIACDDFYADVSNSIFLGKALVEASKLGERFNWLGFIVCPSAAHRLAEVGLPTEERLNYRQWDAPIKKAHQQIHATESIAAYLIGASSPTHGQNTYIPLLEKMAKRIEDPRVQEKYFNTIRFLKHFGVLTACEALQVKD